MYNVAVIECKMCIQCLFFNDDYISRFDSIRLQIEDIKMNGTLLQLNF